jgi:hypothetical protein
MSPETTPLHEAVESLSGALQAGIAVAVVGGLLVALVLLLSHVAAETRSQRHARDLDARIQRSLSRRVDRSGDTHARRSRHDG